MLSKEELKAIGVNPDNMVYPYDEMNIIVNCFGHDNAEDSVYYPDIYQPRKNRVYSCGCTGDGFDMSNKVTKENYIKHLKDSVERLKILAHKLSLQAKELEEKGYISTDCYYAE